MSVKGKALLKHGVKGGSGSGNFGHRGMPGHVGGSIPKGSGGGSGTEAAVIDAKSAWKSVATEDFQNRLDAGDWPASGKPDVIRVYNNTAMFHFKDTSEADASKFVGDFVKTKKLPVKEISTRQTGDYNNDWVAVDVTF